MRTKAILVAVLTTLLWSGSYIVNKYAFSYGIGPLTLSGLRYTIASLTLMLVLRQTEPEQNPLPLRQAFFIGMVCYVMGQGFQYIGQAHLTPTMASMLLNAAMVLFIVLVDRIQLRENTGKAIYLKISILLVGMVLYFSPWSGMGGDVSLVGVVFILLAALGSALNITINRHMLKNKKIRRKDLSVRPMFFGGITMLAAGLLTESLPAFTPMLLFLIAYLAFASGALGFALWIWSQQHLNSIESGSINTAMLIEIALLDVLFFNRKLQVVQWAGIVVVFFAIVAIQRNRVEAGDSRKS